MKNFCRLSIVSIVVSLFVMINTAQAQQVSLLIGIVDLPSVLQKHPIIVDQVSLIQQSFQKEKLEFTRFEQDCQKRVAALAQEHKIGTPEYEAAISPIREELRQKERGFLEKQQKIQAEATKLQFKAVQDVRTAIETVAAQKGIITVLQKFKVNRKNVSEEIAALQEMDNLVVWNRPECEITQDVIAVLAQMVGTPKGNPLGAISNQAQPQAQPGTLAPNAR
ncbi:MAG: OmpH family outer membrane protein [Planctomycetia bacterium]|nr:OmpH family outer membrane protein [Planctomycetia bacterium]